VILRHGWRVERSLRAVALTMSMALLALLVRAVQAVLQPEDHGDLVQASLGQGLTFLVAFVCLLGGRLRLHSGGARAGGAPDGSHGHARRSDPLLEPQHHRRAAGA
jgi:hypothetical protein